MGGADREPVLTRRSLIARGSLAGAALALPELPAWARPAHAASPPAFRNSLSVSPFTEQVTTIAALTDGAATVRTVADVQRMFVAHGASEVYARIATQRVTTDKTAGNAESGWARGLDRARLARDLGLPFNPELGLFAQYGDGATYQEPPDFTDYPEIRLPGPWLSLTIDEMVPALRQYGALAARQILATGARVEVWDLGNEVENGMSGVTVVPLFPDSRYQAPNNVDPAIGLMSVPTLIAMPEPQRIQFCQAHLWPYVGRLLAAARDGIRSVVPGARFSTHISAFAHRTPAVQLAFWETVAAQGYLPDVFGSSYYPTSGHTTFGPTDTLQFMKDIATALGQAHGRQLFIAEYAYPSGQMPPPYPFNDTVAGYAQDDDGQYSFLVDFTRWGIASGRLAGLRQWAPDYSTNSAWEPMSFFHPPPASGPATAKPALRAIEDVVGGAAAAVTGPAGAIHRVPRLLLRLGGRHGRGVRVGVRSPAGAARDVVLELHHEGHAVARRRLASVGGRWHDVLLAPRHGHLHRGAYTVLALQAGRILAREMVRVGLR